MFSKELAHDHVLWFRSSFSLDWLVWTAVEPGSRNPLGRIYLQYGVTSIFYHLSEKFRLIS